MQTKQYFPVLFMLFAIALFNCSNKKTKYYNNGNLKLVHDFEASFLGTYKYAGPDTLPVKRCPDTIYVWRAIVDVTGTSEFLGKITGHFDFCGDTAGYYSNVFAYLVDETGDTLFLSGKGQVVDGRLEDHPEYVTSYWQDTFEFVGGTGKYKEVTGQCYTNDFNSSEDQFSHHNWKGSISLPHNP